MLPLFPLDGIELTYVPQGHVGLAGTGLVLALRNGRYRLGSLDKFAPGMAPAADAGEPVARAHFPIAGVAICLQDLPFVAQTGIVARLLNRPYASGMAPTNLSISANADQR